MEQENNRYPLPNFFEPDTPAPPMARPPQYPGTGIEPRGPMAPARQDRPVYPVPKQIPEIRRPFPEEKESGSSGKSRALLAFVAGGLLSAFSLGLGYLLFSDNSIDGVSAPAREVPASVDEVSNGDSTPLLDGNSAAPAVAVADALGPAVVQIETFRDGRGLGAGSGVVFEDDLIVTNNHVIEGADRVVVRESTGRVLEGTVIGAEPRIDIAVISVENSGLSVAQIATDDSVQVGQSAIAIGSPFLLQQTVTQGIVSAINRPIPARQGQSFVPMIQTDAPINSGNSGGALADSRGRVIGINTSIQTDGVSSTNAGVGFAIPIEIALDTAERLVRGETIEPGFLGLMGEEPSDGSAGVQVTEITAGTAAASSSLEIGDVVQSIDGAPVSNIQELAGLVSVRTPGETAVLQVRRGARVLEVDVTVGRR